MKKAFFVACSVALIFAACGDDGSTLAGVDKGSSSKKGDSPYCVVKKMSDGASMEVYEPGIGWGESGIRYSGSKAISFVNQTFETSASESREKCEELEDQSDMFDEGSFSCSSKGYSFTITLPKSQANDLEEVLEEMKDDCKDLKEDWAEAYKSSSSVSNAKSSSSSNAKSSSSTPSDIPYSTESFIVNPDFGFSSSEGESSRKIHDEKFDAMDLAPEALETDENTLYFEDFDGNILCIYPDSIYMTGAVLDENLSAGTLEFFFRPHEDFFGKTSVLIGSDGARLLVYYDRGNLILMMNKTNVFRYVSDVANVKKDWNYVQVKWNAEVASLYLNNEKVGEMDLLGGYEASSRYGEQELVIGYKSDCCMSGAGYFNSMTTSADFGPIKISVPGSENVTP